MTEEDKHVKASFFQRIVADRKPDYVYLWREERSRGVTELYSSMQKERELNGKTAQVGKNIA
jgi:hypothetical protein